jgi:hypothetical protein
MTAQRVVPSSMRTQLFLKNAAMLLSLLGRSLASPCVSAIPRTHLTKTSLKDGFLQIDLAGREVASATYYS